MLWDPRTTNGASGHGALDGAQHMVHNVMAVTEVDQWGWSVSTWYAKNTACITSWHSTEESRILVLHWTCNGYPHLWEQVIPQQWLIGYRHGYEHHANIFWQTICFWYLCKMQHIWKWIKKDELMQMRLSNMSSEEDYKKNIQKDWMRHKRVDCYQQKKERKHKRLIAINDNLPTGVCWKDRHMAEWPYPEYWRD